MASIEETLSAIPGAVSVERIEQYTVLNEAGEKIVVQFGTDDNGHYAHMVEAPRTGPYFIDEYESQDAAFSDIRPHLSFNR